jgi:hypothetical protein
MSTILRSSCLVLLLAIAAAPLGCTAAVAEPQTSESNYSLATCAQPIRAAKDACGEQTAGCLWNLGTSLARLSPDYPEYFACLKSTIGARLECSPKVWDAFDCLFNDKLDPPARSTPRGVLPSGVLPPGEARTKATLCAAAGGTMDYYGCSCGDGTHINPQNAVVCLLDQDEVRAAHCMNSGGVVQGNICVWYR